MSEPKLISPMLDNFTMGDPISDHSGVRCCPAINNDTNGKYIVKIISVPASQTQLDALLLSGAYSDKEAALNYFRQLSDDIVEEAKLLQKLASLEGFASFDDWQIVPMEDDSGFDVYLLSTYKNTLQSIFRHKPLTHLGAINLGLDICAALAVCRNSGYLYADLKPENIYLTGENEFRIGDLGFLDLNSLKYASLPDRYRSQYTAPEIADAYSELNSTIDIYALGLILYQAYNDGKLPVIDADNQDAEIPAPAYADYEMAEIIIKACAPNPELRWQNPVEMGQALISYMQRNGANDTPITPVLTDQKELSDESEEKPVIIEEESVETIVASDETVENAESVDDNDETLTLDSDELYNDDDVEAEASEIEYEEVTEEVSDMLVQADDLIAHPTPDPVVQPEPIDVPIPAPISLEEDTAEEETQDDADTTDDALDSEESNTEIAEEDYDTTEGEDFSDILPAPKSRKWIRNTLLILIALAIVAVGFLYYKNYYLQPIESIIIKEQDMESLTVQVYSHIDETKLTVICSDTYGNQLTSPVVDGQATFTGLTPNSAYSVKVITSGFHRLTGDTSTAFTTPAQTNIVQFNAVTGAEDGSVILNFTIEGPDSENWKIAYKDDQGESKEVSFSGHMVTLNGLTVGTEYKFTLIAGDDIYINGEDTIQYTAAKVVKAENLLITGYINNQLTASWTVSGNATIESWTVRCYNDNGFDETKVVTETNVAFDGVDPTNSYTIEITAAGMSVNQRIVAPANSVTVTGFSADTSNASKITLSWDAITSMSKNDLTLTYTVDGSAVQEVAIEKGNKATINNNIPGAKYTFTLQSKNGTSLLGNILYLNTKAPTKFSGYNITTEKMEFKMCKRPSVKKWDRFDLKKSDYTTTFEAGQKASFLIHLLASPKKSSDKISVLFVIRNENDTVFNASTATYTWKKMWSSNYGKLDIPNMPKTAGNYSIDIYFNGQLAHSQDFTITE